MRKTIFAVVALTMFATAATAGTPGSSNAVSAKLTGKNATSYVDPVFGAVTCRETQHPQFDTVSCTLATPRPDLAGTTATVLWNSDFTGASGGSFTYTFSDDGSTYSGIATY